MTHTYEMRARIARRQRVSRTHKIQRSNMKFPPSTKAAFFAALSILSPSTAFSTARQSLPLISACHGTSFQRRSMCSASNERWAANYNIKRSLALPLSLRGGTAMFSTISEEIEKVEPVYRLDYKPLAFKVSNVSMNFDIRDGKTFVESELTIVPGYGDGGKS